MANRIFQLTVEGLNQGAYRETVLHFQTTGSNDNDTVAAGESLTNGWDSNIKTLWLATVPASYSLTQLTARRVVLKPSATVFLQYQFAAYTGSRGTAATGEQTCPSIFLVPTMGTKSGGRIFWPTIPQGDVNQSVYGAAWKTAVDAVIAAMVSGFTNAGITWTLGVFSRKLGTVSNVVSHSYSPFIGFQSRRRKPLGAN